eukprot:COSAG02_NODE_865_length_16381_cov_14.799533_6_plen_96_part_00
MSDVQCVMIFVSFGGGPLHPVKMQASGGDDEIARDSRARGPASTLDLAICYSRSTARTGLMRAVAVGYVRVAPSRKPTLVGAGRRSVTDTCLVLR